jgi:hypothetical protein
MSRNRFWIVVKDDTKLSAMYRHSTLEQAKKEAERLATANTGHRFYVMEVIGSCVYKPVVWENIHDESDNAFPF